MQPTKDSADDYLLERAGFSAWSMLRRDDETTVQAVYRLFRFTNGLPQEAPDLAAALPDFVKDGSDLSDTQITRYSLGGLAARYFQRGASEQTWSEPDPETGKSFEIVMDTPIGVGLFYKGLPNAFVGLMPEDPETLLIHEYHGITGEQQMAGRVKKKLSPWGLEPLNWKELLVHVAEQVAEKLDFHRFGIQSGHNSMSLKRNCDDPWGITLEQAVKIYDGLASQLGFVQGSNKNWYKVLTVSERED